MESVKNKKLVLSREFSNERDLFDGDVTGACRKINEKFSSVTGMEIASIYTLSNAETNFICVDRYLQKTNTHTTGAILSALRHTGLIEVLDQNAVTLLENTPENALIQELVHEGWLEDTVRSILLVPTRFEGKVDGFLMAEDTRARTAIETEQIPGILRCAELCSHVRQNKMIRREVSRVASLTDILDQIGDNVDAMDLLQIGLEDSVRLMDASSALFFFVYPQLHEVRCSHVANLPAKMTTLQLKYGQDVAGMTAETGELLLVDRYTTWSRRDPALAKTDAIGSVIAFPVRYQGEIVGVVQINRKTRDAPFQNIDKKRALDLAGIFSAVVQHHAQTVESRTLDIINSMVMRVDPATNTRSQMDRYLDLVTGAFRTRMGYMSLSDHEVCRGFTFEEEKILADGINFQKFPGDQTVVIHYTRQREAPYVDIAKTLEDAGVFSAAFVTLATGTDTRDVLGVFFDVPHTWTPMELRALDIFTQHIEQKVKQLGLIRMDSALENMLLRYDVITGNLNHSLNHREAVQFIGSGAVNIFEPNHAAIYITGPEQHIECVWTYAMPEDTRQAVERLTNERASAFLFGNPKPVFIDDLNLYRRTVDLQSLRVPDSARSGAFSPLVFNGRVIGTIAYFFDTAKRWKVVETRIMEAYANQAAVTFQNVTLVEQLENQIKDVALTLARAMDARDTSTPGYSAQLANWVETTARAMGCSERELADIHWAAMLHDIGKVVIPDQVLKKPGPLSEEEWSLVRRSPVEGERMLQSVPDLSKVGRIIRSMRERYDGSGYPDGRKGVEIPLGARILAVADAYGTIIDNKPYRKAKKPEEALEELRQNKGKQFDPAVVDTFLKVIKDKMN